jgi:hypothetical protein
MPTPSFIEMELRSADRRRHWSPASQPYAPADVLVEYLADGWTIHPVVGLEEHWRGAGRRVDVYYFELTKDTRELVMPVHGNPVVRGLIQHHQLRVVLRKTTEVVLVGGEDF